MKTIQKAILFLTILSIFLVSCKRIKSHESKEVKKEISLTLNNDSLVISNNDIKQSEWLEIEKKEKGYNFPCSEWNRKIIINNDMISLDLMEPVQYEISKIEKVNYGYNIYIKNVEWYYRFKWIDKSKGISKWEYIFKNKVNESFSYLTVRNTQENIAFISKIDCNDIKKSLSEFNLNDNNSSDKTENTTLFKNFIFKFSTSKIEDEDGNEIQKIKINLKNKETNKVQQIDFIPKSLITKFDVSLSNTVSYFDMEKSIINSYQEIEGGSILIALDVNFDGLEDFAIINYQGSNGGPQYAYYVQKTNQQFVLDSYLTENVRFCPSEINKNKKTLTITHPSGCCQIQTYKIQIQRNGEWKEISSNLEDIK